ncbi:MAG: TetR/AcrR family transcriptional regulator [Alphaproteobacteria bacterium]|nr:TetR/AcrR family transcriptional regulator [Alphaproteobacteria bacterium]
MAKAARVAGSAPVSAFRPAPAGGVNFAAYLEAMAAQIRKARSGDKTRLRLMAKGAQLLDSTGFRELNVEDVCRAADLAKGTFYIHFESKEVFLEELARRYVDFEGATVPMRHAETSRFAQLRLFHHWYEQMFALNAGVLRCLVQMGEISAAMRDLWHQRNRRLVDRQTDWIAPPPTALDPALARLAIRTIGGMIDDSLFERYRVQVGPGREQPDDPELLVELHTLLMYRAIHGADPDPRELGPTRAMLDWQVDH